jgi:hypothetical protein
MANLSPKAARRVRRFAEQRWLLDAVIESVARRGSRSGTGHSLFLPRSARRASGPPGLRASPAPRCDISPADVSAGARLRGQERVMRVQLAGPSLSVRMSCRAAKRA